LHAFWSGNETGRRAPWRLRWLWDGYSRYGEERVMSHVRIGVYAVTGGTAKQVADQAHGGMLDVFRAHPGFQSYGLAETPEGKVVSVTLWDSEEEAEQANAMAASWVSKNMADRVRLESTQVGDFMFFENA
jgi:heme-degrading monooxygenase HmoA